MISQNSVVSENKPKVSFLGRMMDAVTSLHVRNYDIGEDTWLGKFVQKVIIVAHSFKIKVKAKFARVKKLQKEALQHVINWLNPFKPQKLQQDVQMEPAKVGWLQKIMNWISPFKVKRIEVATPEVLDRNGEAISTGTKVSENATPVNDEGSLPDRTLEETPDLGKLGNPKRLIETLNPMIDSLRTQTHLTDMEMGEISLMSRIVNAYGTGKVKYLNKFHIQDKFQLEVARSVAQKLQQQGIKVFFQERCVKNSSDSRAKIHQWRLALENKNQYKAQQLQMCQELHRMGREDYHSSSTAEALIAAGRCKYGMQKETVLPQPQPKKQAKKSAVVKEKQDPEHQMKIMMALHRMPDNESANSALWATAYKYRTQR